MARQLASLDALVVGIDITHYLKEPALSKEECHYPASDFEELSKFVQLKLNFPSYRTPVLVGYSSGATLIYTALVQAPSNTFLGGISMGFCPDLPITKPMCRGDGLEWTLLPKGKGYNFLPAKSLERPWIALQGTLDQVCEANSTEIFVQKVPKGELVILPKVGHGFSVPQNWLPQFRKAFSSIIESVENEQVLPKPGANGSIAPLSDLPIIEVPAKGRTTNLMGVLITGDGGWAVADKGIAESLADRGISVVGLNSLRYFWKKRTVESTAQDLNRILQHYSVSWNRSEVIVIGYSLGADVLPFMLNRIPKERLRMVKAIALLGPSATAEFEFHIGNWMLDRKRPSAQPILPELEKLRGKNLICLYGTQDGEAICPKLPSGLAKIIPLHSGHRIGKNYEPIVDAILKQLR